MLWRFANVLLPLLVSAGLSHAAEDGSSSPRAVFPGAAWERSEPAAQGLDPHALKQAIAYLDTHSGRDQTRELAIVRHGYLIHAGTDIDKVHGVWSCTKSFTSTVLGLLVDDGVCRLDTPAHQYVPALQPQYARVTLEHFATMTSGYRARGDEPLGGYIHGPSRTPFDPDPHPLFAPPGSQFAYWDSAMNMFGLVLTRAAGESLEDVFRRRIAEPIGMDRTKWRWGVLDRRDGLDINGGSGNQGAHIQISARELARFGLLFLNQGNWNGRQLISREWVARATSAHVAPDLPWAQPSSNIDGRGVYGLNWWTNSPQHDGQLKWPDVPRDTYAAQGHNNNRMFVIPEWDMVVVRLGLDQNDVLISDESWNAFLAYLGRARQ